MQNEKKIALLVDNELNFNERVQTMVEFKDRSGEIVDIQREDTQNRLENVKRVKITTKGRWVSIAAFVLAVGIFASSIVLVPQKIVAAEPEPDYEMSDYEKQLLQNLIEYVERSEAVEKEKKNMFFTFDVKEIIKANINERYSAYKLAKEVGLMTINEMRKEENMNFIEGLDVINVGLGAVLYDTNKHEYYVPNKNETSGDQEAIQKVLVDKELDTEFEQSGNQSL